MPLINKVAVLTILLKQSNKYSYCIPYFRNIAAIKYNKTYINPDPGIPIFELLNKLKFVGKP